MITLTDVRVRHAPTHPWALDGVTLDARPGERVLLCGRSGSGKSTLLEVAAGLSGALEQTGVVRLAGRDPRGASPRDRAGQLGFVGQDPGDQLVAGSVGDEVAFGPEGRCASPDAIAERVRASLARVGLAVALDRDPAALSGGQQQRLVVAAALAGGGALLLLDEPLARLDGEGADRLLGALTALAAEGVCVVLAEHRLDRCLPWATRVVVLEAGRVVWDGPPEPVALEHLGLLSRGVDRLPVALGEPIARWGPLSVSRGARRVLDGLSLELRAGERVAVVGPNGAGKSTLLGALAGRLAPPLADVKVIEVPQDHDLALFCDTVRDELAYGPIEGGLSPEEVHARVERVAAPLGLIALYDRPPQALSSGERLRVAVGAALTCGADVLLLDEPTAGQDAASVAGLLRALDVAAPRASVVFASHDLALVEREAHRVLRLESPVGPDEGRRSTDRSVGLDPRTRLALIAAIGALSVMLDRPAALGALAAGSALALLWLPVGWTWRRRALGLGATLVWSTALSQGLFYGELPRTALVSAGSVTVWREGVVHGVAQSLRMLATAYAGVALAVTTPTDRLVAALGALRVPWSFGLLAAVALRAVPGVADAWLVVRRARDARGRPVWARSPWAWLALEARLLRPVAARALRRSRALARSLDARGFDPEAPRTVARPLRWGWWDGPVLVAAATGVGAVLLLEVLYGAYVSEILYIPSLRPVYGWVRAWL